MSTPTNAFWREVLDYLPGLTLLFRIDDNEAAHLMFVSESVSTELGFSPEEYVLISEEQGSVVSQDLEKLIDVIADLSHQGASGQIHECALTDRNGVNLAFSFDFRLFKTKTLRNNLIAVSLFPAGSIPVVTDGSMSEGVGPGIGHVYESPLINEVVSRLEALAGQPHHILLRGDKSVGKRTLAEKIARQSALLIGNQQVWILNLEELDKSVSTGSIFAGLDPSDSGQTLLDDIEKGLQLVIIELGLMPRRDQADLLKLISNREQSGRKTRIIATSSVSVESLMEQGKINPALVYRLSFISVFIPTLKERPEDVSAFTKMYSQRLEEVLELRVTDKQRHMLGRLSKEELAGNFSELYDRIRLILFTSSDPSLNTQKPMSVGKDEQEQILPYEEKTRRYLQWVLEFTGGKIYGKDGAAALLKIKPTTLQSKLKKLGVR
jgi:transcriptional regulator of acetoin/glycerol metabolism